MRHLLDKTTRTTLMCLAAVGLLLTGSTSASGIAAPSCSPSTTILESPRAASIEVQAKAINDRGDVVGFADANRHSSPIHAILWKGGKASGAVDLGVLPGYVASEAYGVNDDRVVFGLLYDRKERTYPFRWQDGRMTLLRDPSGRLREAQLTDPSRNPINERGEIVGTLIVDGSARGVRWATDGRATFLPALPGHTWTWAHSVSEDGVVSGWSRKQPREHAVENAVIWTSAGTVVPLKAPRGRADGVANASNSSGLIVGLLGNPGSAQDPESDQAAVWRTSTAAPLLLGPATPYAYAELFDVNESGQAIGASGRFTRTGFPLAHGVIWRPGWTSMRALAVPRAARVNPVLVTGLTDINRHGAIVGNVYGLAAADYSKLRRVDPVLWTCAIGV
jgi:probable HAF family extracellular repeat protein